MWKIAICDDEESIRSQIINQLRKIENKYALEFNIKEFESGEDLMTGFNPDTDLLILDIAMGRLSGMNAASLLREKGYETCIIFLTTMVQYALKGYEVRAFSFIQKPLKEAQFERIIMDALKRQRILKEHTITLQKGNGFDVIDINRILYVETRNHTSTVVTDLGREEYAIGLNRLEKMLSKHGFALCHKSYIVNFSEIRTLRQTDAVMSNSDVIPISKHRRKAFAEEYVKFMGVNL